MAAPRTGGAGGAGETAIQTIARFFARLTAAALAMGGWRAGALACVLGGVLTLALPPLHILPALVVGLTGGFWLLCGARGAWGAFGRGLAFGLGYFTLGLYWIGFAFLVDAVRFAWMAPFAVVGLAAVLALYPAVVFWVFHRVRKGASRPDVPGVLLFAGLWVLAEWLRGWVLTGFPWNPLGEVFDGSVDVLQLASLSGVYGLSLLAVLVGTAPAVLGTGNRGAARFVVAIAALLMMVWAGGAWRLAGATTATVPGVQLRLVQANISQQDKWRPDLRQAHVIKQAAMSVAPAAPAASGALAPTVVIWGETAVPFYLARDPARRALVATAVPDGGLLITGAPRAVRHENPAPGQAPVQVWNSLHAVNRLGEIVATYDKAHLVPFGEYVPFRALLSRIMDVGKITAGSIDFSAGPGVQTTPLPGLPAMGALICYEVIFPGAVASPGAGRPGWLLNLTNDGWYGKTSGPHQHLALTRMRAVEEGLPLVRVAGTGISAVIDAHGRITGALGLGVEGVLDRPLPVALAPTVYARFGNAPTLALLFVMIIFAGLGTRKNPHTN